MPTTSTNVETDIDKLSQIVALPYRPVHATWQVLPMGDTGAGLGPNDWALVAAIHFEEADLEEIRAEAAGLPPMGDLHVQPEFVKDWFPSDVQAVFVPQAASGYLTLSVPRFRATRFMKPPLDNGYFLVTPEGTVLLYLFTT
jgi:hypothetical protein